MKPARILTALTVLAMVLSAGSAGASSNSNAADARSEHQRIVDFWTHERVAQAVPRDFVFDPATGRYDPYPGPPPHAGGPGGGGGDNGDDSSSVVTGSSWKGEGQIDGAVGKVLFEMDGSYYVCSATVIDDEDGAVGVSGNSTALILTAAHCVYDESDGTEAGFATMWTFIPDYDAAPAPLSTSSDAYCDDTLYGCWTAEAMAVHTGYASAGSFGDQAVLHDFGVVRVGAGGKGNAELDALVTEQGYLFTGVSIDGDVSGYAFGYPAAKKYKGNDLIYCAGPIDGDPLNDVDSDGSPDTYRMNECEMTGGSSGGSWLINFDEKAGSGTVTSVNSYGYTGVKAMHGPILNSDTKDVYDLAKSTGGIAP